MWSRTVSSSFRASHHPRERGGAEESRQVDGANPELILKLDSLDMDGRSYPMYSYQFKVEGTSKTRPTEAKVKAGAVIGAIALGAFGGSAKGETSAAGKLADAGNGGGDRRRDQHGCFCGDTVSGPFSYLPNRRWIFILPLRFSLCRRKRPKKQRTCHKDSTEVGPALYVRVTP